MVSALVVLLAAAVASADDAKKPAAVAASTSLPKTSGAPASGKPAAVQASTGKPSFATHLEVVDASVKLVKRWDKNGNQYKAASTLTDVRLTVKGHGLTTKFGEKKKGTKAPPEFEGLTAFQILVEQGYFKYQKDVGFIPTSKYATVRDISDGSGPVQGNDHNKNENKNRDTTPGMFDVKGGPDLVDPEKTESVAEDPSQEGTFGGLMGADFEVDEKCMAGRSKMYSDCTERCKNSRSSSEEYGDCVEKCSEDALAAWGECPAPARTRADEWE